MTPYHSAWLAANDHVTEEMLARWLKEGFDIHHLDGDHENNDEKNLVLIWSGDHMMLHNGSKRMTRIAPGHSQRRSVTYSCGCSVSGNVIKFCDGGEQKIKPSAKPLKVVAAYHAVVCALITKL